MLTIAIPQLYVGASGQKGAYNRQEVGLARAFAALGVRAVVLYPDTSLQQPKREEPEPNVIVYTCPAYALGVSALYKSWEVLRTEQVQAVHCMGDNALGVPGLYRFCRRNRIFFYSVLGAVRSQSENPNLRRLMDWLNHRNLRIYAQTPTYTKTPAVQAELEKLGIPCAGVLPVGLDVSIIPTITDSKAALRQEFHLEPTAPTVLFVGRLDAYKRPLELADVLALLPPQWRLVVIGDGSLAEELDARLEEAGLSARVLRLPRVPNAEVQKYYHACDVFLNLSSKEIFGMSLLEAMYAGCPPVARHAPGPDFIIEDGVSGLLANSTEELAAAVQKAVQTPALAQAAQSRIQQHFLWESSARTALQMLETEGGLHR